MTWKSLSPFAFTSRERETAVADLIAVVVAVEMVIAAVIVIIADIALAIQKI